VFQKGLDVTRTVHGAGSDLSREGGDDVTAVSAPQDQRRAEPIQIGSERPQAAVQPPAAGPTHLPAARREVVEHVNWGDGQACGAGSGKCRQIACAEILSKPDNNLSVSQRFRLPMLLQFAASPGSSAALLGGGLGLASKS
jgi:hypothetical protein